MIIEELLLKIENLSQDNTILYFITRVLKPDVKSSSKVMDKYVFKVYQIDVNDEIREHLYTLTKDQLNSLVKKKTELHEYDVITDDSAQLFTYQMNNKAMSFYDVVNNQLSANPAKIKCLEEILVNEELWAYCVGFYNEEDEWVYTFRKILAAKVAIDEKDNNKKSKLQKTIRTIFNSKSQKLELIEGETVNLDKQIDCIYFQDTFYIAKKTQFEQIIGLEEEYKIQAMEVVTELTSTKMIEGLEIISKQIDQNPSIHKKLVRLTKIGNYRDLDAKTIKKMQKICKKYGEILKLKDGKLFIENEDDITLTLKVLADYYKLGEVSGKAYGTYAGKQLEAMN
ncbi:Kiwa anti-phage protein KwaB-like domain-containing protein [Sphingobacterium faecium]|uniref:Kiwa anti-phage protein KwaB-like domain-containing protein n=1 Tax=Sphingobacterium faecium TaxID=34087 RepID=UPI0032097B42